MTRNKAEQSDMDGAGPIPTPAHIPALAPIMRTLYRGRVGLITGASAGIGMAFAHALAARGADLVLVARRKDRLEALAGKIRTDHNVRVITISADLADPRSPAFIVDILKDEGVAIDILINNAGFGLPGFYTENAWPAHRDFLELMVTSYVHLTHAFLPGMQARHYGRIIQVASLAGLTPGSAGHTLYGASKAFLVSFAQSLAAENDGTGVNVTALCPGFTYSEFHDVNGTRSLVSALPAYMFMDAAPVVEQALGAVERGHVIFVPGRWNKFVAWLVKALPRPWAASLAKSQSARFRRKN